jgi:hypothetical protein
MLYKYIILNSKIKYVIGNQVIRFLNADIEWRKLKSYKDIFDELKVFLNNHTPQEAMILTFSSAITVNGSMGDIARFRKYFSENGIQVNTNHKKMDPEKYFLTTANSSKGLERDYVICFLTFPS